MKRLGCWLSGLMLLAIANSAFAASFCVDTALSLQNALSQSGSNGQDDKIQVVQGTYYGKFYYGGTDAKYIAIEGGYTTGCSGRTIDPTNTILDGMKTGSVLTTSTPSAYGQANILIQGLTIRNGTGTVVDSVAYGGGVQAVVSSSTLSLDSNIIANNSASVGGGIYVRSVSSLGGEVIFINNKIDGNVAESYNDYGGGGIFAMGERATFTFSDNIISNNRHIGSFPAGDALGGGIEVRGYSNKVTVTNNVIEGNSATSESYSYGGGVSIDSLTTPITFANNFIHNNLASGGDYGSSEGGGVYIDTYEEVKFINNLIYGNSASSSCSVSWCEDNYGGGLKVAALITELSNNTIAGNVATHSGGLRLVQIEITPNESIADFYNNIFWNNSALEADDLSIANDPPCDGILGCDFISGPITFKGNNFPFSRPDGYEITIPVAIDETNLSEVDPQFVNVLDGDFHLQNGSPMIDTGFLGTPNLPETDIEGNPRIVGGRVDIGAFEFDGGSGFNLSVILQGTGLGRVTSSPAGIDCGIECDQPFPPLTNIVLTATPNTNSNFVGWNGDGCFGTSTCTVTMDANKSVTANFTLKSYTVTATAGTGGSISPPSRTVTHGATTTFTVTPYSGYSINSASGCGGSLNGNTYSTGAITGACMVSVNFNLKTYLVTATAGTGGKITPTSSTVNHGATTSFTVTPNTGYSINTVSGCGGSLSGNTYTTGSITGACTVTASFSQNLYQFCDKSKRTLINTIGPGSYNYSSEAGIDTQGTVIIRSDAEVVLTAPKIQLNPGFRVESGAQLSIRAQSVTCPK